ncbi:probable N-acetyltransferase camello [Actinia tenebrosa]|uniref:Probable N-acetyltransferase camello n=1 Tax=Actinia tenebrosa TaxID=6105 RepID=A0A6P8HJE0_ACTTE|nr:probable N-acetyltransferase camello [Actinia tenebrosa]
MSTILSTTTKVSYTDVYRVLLLSSSVASFKMRPFRFSDNQEIQKIYLEAHQSFVFPAFISGLLNPYIFSPALLVAHLVAIGTGSIIFALGALAFFITAIYVSYDLKVMNHINHSLSTDLDNIGSFYQSGRDESSFWVVETEGRVAGFVGVIQRDGATVELQRLTVAAEFRRRGIGEKLCRHVISFYKRKKFRKLILECTEVHIAGKNLYVKLGFDVHERVQDPFALSAITLEHYSLNLT